MPLFNSKKPTHNFPPPVGYNTVHSEEKKKRTSITNFFTHPPAINLKRKHQDDVEEGPQQQEEHNKRKKTAAAAAAAAAANVKAHMGNMSRLFQRIAVTVNRSTRGTTPRKEAQPEFVDVFQTMQLPTIEWTDGNLGILPQQHPATVTAALPQQHRLHHHPVPNLLQEKLRQLSQQSQQQLQALLQSPQLQPPQPLPLPVPQEEDEDSVFCINTSEYLEFPVPPSTPAMHYYRRQESISSTAPPTRLNSLIIVEEEEDSDDESMPSTPFNDSMCYDDSNHTTAANHQNNKTEQLAFINTPSPLSTSLL